MTTIKRLAAALLLTLPAAVADAQTTLTFDGVATNAAGFNPTPFTALSGYRFENWGVLTSASTFGTGTNATSGTKFAYGFAGFDNFVYRTDVNFNVFTAALSFRTLDGNTAPADIVIRGYRGADEVFTRTLTLTNTAQVFTLNAFNIEELAFETPALDAPRGAVLALDDLAVSAVPEPGALVLTLSGLGALGLVAVRRRYVRVP